MDESIEDTLKLYRELENNRRDFQKIRDILRTNKCDGLCGLCRLFENRCLVWERKHE